MALVGAGTIAASYVTGLRATPGFDVVAICARSVDSAADFATRHGLVPMTFDAMLANRSIDYVLNLTPASAHEGITRICLLAGKSVYSEKPLAATLAAADALIALADEQRLLLACAPATFLWPPLATTRRLIAEGAVGQLVGGISSLVYPGPELFHPNPGHLYEAAAGPLHDMGVYQVTALMELFGPISGVAAMATRARDERVVLIGPDAGTRIPVETATHFHAQLRHINGAITSMTVGFDGVSPVPPFLHIFGRTGALVVDAMHTPNAAVRHCATSSDGVAVAIPKWSDSMQSIGPASAWSSFHTGQKIETGAARARDVLAVLLAIDRAALESSFIEIAPRSALLKPVVTT